MIKIWLEFTLEHFNGEHCNLNDCVISPNFRYQNIKVIIYPSSNYQLKIMNMDGNNYPKLLPKSSKLLEVSKSVFFHFLSKPIILGEKLFYFSKNAQGGHVLNEMVKAFIELGNREVFFGLLFPCKVCSFKPVRMYQKFILFHCPTRPSCSKIPRHHMCH